jgi:hypothetical protein
VLIFDVEDMLRSVEKLVSDGRIERVRHGGEEAPRRDASACWWSTTR